MRKIPATMATQHPDNATVPYWGETPAISTSDEVEECYRAFSDLGCDEYMWDWEGKFVDEAVIDRLFNKYHEYFKKQQLGRDKFLTFRIPNIWEERGIRLARSFMAIITAALTAKDFKVHGPPLFEVILPMTTSADQLITIQKKFQKVVRAEKSIFEEKAFGSSHLEMIPLIEGTATLLESRSILKKYIKNYEKLYGKKPKYIRPFIARSDPALDAGYIAGVLSARGALAEYYRFQRETGVKVFPILGVGSLPFRGGLSPTTIADFLKLYGGVRTVTVQSAFRYDYDQTTVKRALAKLSRDMPKVRGQRYSDIEVQEVTQITKTFARYYRPTVQALAPMINDFAQYIPSHRERIPHTGHFGYSRKVGKKGVAMPRAITFVAIFASLGVPPSLIGTGRGLRTIVKQGKEKALHNYFPDLEKHLLRIGNYLNWENLKFLCRKHEAWEQIRNDVSFIEDYLGMRLGPQESDHFIHRNLTSNIYHFWQKGQFDDLREEIVQAAIARKSLG